MINVLDHAMLWRIIPIDDPEALANKIFTWIPNKTNVTCVSQIRFEPDILERLITLIPETHDDKISRALGAAMPYYKGILQKRSVSLRRLYYGNLWARLQKDQWYHSNQVSNMAESYFDSINKTAGYHERNWRIFPWYSTFTGMTQELQTNTFNDINHFLTGIRKLNDCRAKGSGFENFKDLFKDLKAFMTHWFYLRTLGCLLVDIAVKMPEYERYVERTLSIEYTENGTKYVLNIGSS